MTGKKVSEKAFSAAIFKRGQKHELFGDGDDLQTDGSELYSKLQELLEIWQLPRTGKDLSAAIWRPEHQAAEVVLQRGRLYNYMGFTWGKKIFLHIEEVVYLIDRANVLFFEDTPKGEKRLISLQEAQEMMVACGVTMDMFLIYCKLMRAGYIVQRHPSQWVVKTSETPTQVWGRPRTSLSFSTSTSHTRTHTHKQTPTSEREVPDQPPHKRHRSCTQTEEDAGMGGNDDKEDKTSRNRRWWPSPSAWIRLSGEGVKGSVGGGVEVEVEVETTASRLFETLPRCLVEKTALQRAQQLFPNMQPFHLLGSEEVVDVAAINELGIPMLHYDVYQANSSFSRKAPDTPLCVMTVWEGGGLPTFTAMNALDGAVGAMPLRYACEELGDIANFAIARIELKKILS